MKTLLSLLCTLILCVPCYAAPIGLKRFGHNYFGSGIDGFVHLTGNTTWTNTANSDWIIKQCTTFQLNSGKTLTIQNPGKGVIIYTQGNCTISGTINLNGMAGNITPPSEGVWFPATQLSIPSATRYAQSGTTLVASCFDGTSVWMTDANNNGVRKVNTSTGNNTLYTLSGSNCTNICFDGGSNVWAADINGSVWKIPISTGVGVQYTLAGSYPTGITSDGTNIWVPDSNNHGVWKVPISTGVGVFYAISSSNPAGACYDNTSVWLGDQNGNGVWKVNTSTGGAVACPCTGLASGSGINALCYAGGYVWANDGNNIAVWQITPSTGAATGYYIAAGIPNGICSDGSNLWIGNGRNSSGSANVTQALSMCKINMANPASNQMLVLPGTSTGENMEAPCFDGTNIWCGDSSYYWKIPAAASKVAKVNAAIYLPAAGGTGGTASSSLANGVTGNACGTQGPGGGGSGASYNSSHKGGNGAAGTCFGGGSGGSGAGATNSSGNAGAAYCGQGGNGVSCTSNSASGGGAGYPVGTGQKSGSGTVTAPTGGGGASLYIICGGQLTLGGTEECDGAQGGNTTTASGSYALGGGGAGGGVVQVLYAGALLSYVSGNCHANAGVAGTASGGNNYSGGTGGAGFKNVAQIGAP